MLVKSIAARGAMLQPGRFQEMDDRIFYARSRDDDAGFRGVVVSDHSDPSRPFTIFAEAGRITLDEVRGALVFRLENGDIEMEPADTTSSQRLSFERFDYAFEAAGLRRSVPRRKPAVITSFISDAERTGFNGTYNNVHLSHIERVRADDDTLGYMAVFEVAGDENYDYEGYSMDPLEGQVTVFFDKEGEVLDRWEDVWPGGDYEG